jgi:hypothetical protein
MSKPFSGPSIDRYPRYAPAAKPPFWSRKKVAIGAGLLGALLGLTAGGGGAADADQPSANKQESSTAATSIDVQGQVDEAVAQTRSDMEDALDTKVEQVMSTMKHKLQKQREVADTRLARAESKALAAQRNAVAEAVAKTRAKARAATAAAVADARAAALAQAPAPTPVGGSAGGTDPNFDYCYQANAAGYGPYFEGQDPEYQWYDDADHDGAVCE